MPRFTAHPKIESFNFRVDPALKAAFTAATAHEDKPAGQVLRDFMRSYVDRRRAADITRQSHAVAIHAAKAASDEAAAMRWMEEVADTDGWTG